MLQALRKAHSGSGGGGGSIAERDLPYEVPELRYVEVDTMRVSRMRSNLNNWWGDQIPIAICVRCKRRYTEDPNRDSVGEPMHEDPEDDLEVVCNDCLERAFTDSLKRGIEEVIDERLGQVAEMSRRMVESLNIQMASSLTARAEIFRETLDQVRTDIEMVPSHLPPTSAPVGGISAPGPQPSVPDRAQRNVDAIITGVVVVIVGNALWYAILWYAQTGTWEFEELLAYFFEVVLQHLDSPLAPPVPPPS
jgi:hypothetical protein